MINIQNQIDYWIKGVVEEELLIWVKRQLHGLFFCDLVIEKAIKAH